MLFSNFFLTIAINCFFPVRGWNLLVSWIKKICLDLKLSEFIDYFQH